LYQKLARPWTITGGIPELDEIAKDNKHMLQGDSYGGSKALVNALTVLQAKLDSNKDIIINSVTPGWIMTDMTNNSRALAGGCGKGCRTVLLGHDGRGFYCQRTHRAILWK
jgi:NAD(P)-dependent dehydrogenase (short-subunit alcohol dehydrogenase family)